MPSARWNFRVVRTNDQDGTFDPPISPRFSLIEVYYDDEGDMYGFCNADVQNYDSIDDLKDTLKDMLEALSQPVLIRNGQELVERES